MSMCSLLEALKYAVLGCNILLQSLCQQAFRFVQVASMLSPSSMHLYSDQLATGPVPCIDSDKLLYPGVCQTNGFSFGCIYLKKIHLLQSIPLELKSIFINKTSTVLLNRVLQGFLESEINKICVIVVSETIKTKWKISQVCVITKTYHSGSVFNNRIKTLFR